MIRSFVHILIFFISLSLFSQDEKRLALVIGNANYEKGELKNPVNDARLIASTLDSLEFDVILKENLESQTSFKRAILEFGKKRSNYDVAFVYYAGHGVQISGENYLLPTKVEFSTEDEVEMFGVSVQDIMRYLRDQTDEVNILILDACRDNPFESNWNTTRSLKGGGLAKIPPPTGSLIAFSTDSGQTAPDGEGDNSIYTISLAKNMLLEDTSIDQVFRNVRTEVLNQTDGMQRPVEATQLTGQTFYLNPTDINTELDNIQKLLNEKDYEAARTLIEPILSKNPNSSRALELRANIFFNTQKFSLALVDINELISKDPGYLHYYIKRHEIYVKLSKLDLAINDLNYVINNDPENHEYYYERSYFYLFHDYSNDFDKALSDINTSIQLNPVKDIYSLGLRAKIFFYMSDYESSIKDYLLCEDLDLDKSFARKSGLYNSIGVLYEKLDILEKALDYYSKQIYLTPNEPLLYVNRGKRYAYDLNDFNKAKKDFDKAIEIDPNNDDFYNSRANFYHYFQKYKEATLDFNKAIDISPKNIINYFDRADHFLDIGEYDRSISDYFRCIDLDEEFSIENGVYNNIAVSYERSSRYTEAINFYSKQIEFLPDALAYINRAGVYADNLNEFQKAKSDLTKAINFDPNDDYTYYTRGFLYLKSLLNYKDALNDFNSALEINPKNKFAFFERANTYVGLKNYEMAIQDFIKAEKLDSDNELKSSFRLYNQMAITYDHVSDKEKVLEYLNKQINFTPSYSLAYRNRGIFYWWDLSNYKMALADFNKTIEVSPNDSSNYIKRGDFYYYLEEYEKALIDYTSAIQIKPSSGNFYKRAVLRHSNEDYELAVADYLRALELDVDQKTSKNEYLLNGLALSYKQLGNLDNAIIYLKKEIELSPLNSLPYRNLGDIYVELRQFDKAREIYDNLINVDSKNAQNYVVRAQFFLTDIDDYSSSISDLSKAIELEIDNSDFYFTRAQVYFKTKEYKSALNDFEKALELNPEITNSEYIYAEIAKCHAGIGDFEKALNYFNMEIDLGENAIAYSERALFYDSYLYDFEKAKLDFEKAVELEPNTNNIVLQYLNFLHYNKKYEQALEIAKKAREIDSKDPQSDFVSASIYMEIDKPFKALNFLNSCIGKVIKFSGEGYYITDRYDSKIDLSEVFLMRGNFYRDKDKELMCNDYKEALNYTFDNNQKVKINSLLLENCGI